VHLSFHCFPEEWHDRETALPAIVQMYPDLAQRDEGKTMARVIKRAMDLVGSCLGLIALSPMFLGIAVAIKLSSPGPVLFRQRRIGQHGVPFTFVKFRSMYTANDSAIHKEYVKRLIAGNVHGGVSEAGDTVVYKITEDPRVTRVGRFLRRTSLDELPQLLNVLRGEMSLVGPRPPIPYEVDSYDIWHRRRVLEVKPGITGLWQVNGRSALPFDDMVRLDLKYAEVWSVWLDIKILLQTPHAVVSRDGAY
jgi:exopolysaccharide biosynthesis polyprenyl glycosylphosphotransferase